MKNTILTIIGLLAIGTSPLLAQQITFNETSHNFGTMKEADGKISHDFTFTNTGDKPLILS